MSMGLEILVLMACIAAPQQAAPAVQNGSATIAAETPLAVFHSPLLREGSFLIEAPATIAFEPQTRVWKATIRSAAADSQQREFTLLPCTRLAEMQKIAQSAPDMQVTFQLTGRLFVFRGVNYLLPTHAPILQESSAKNEAARPVQPANDIPQQSGQTNSQNAHDIMRELEQSTGPVARSSARALSSNDAADVANSSSKALPREESSITNRRGKISRDRSGGWMFVFDADASGLADPPMKLLPCFLLERIEDYARRQGGNAPALLGGQAYVYQGQAYLLPTVFHVPKERTPLSP